MEKLIASKKEYEIVSLLKEDEFHKSYKCSRGNKLFFIKKFNDISSFKASLENHRALKKYGICIPKLLKADKKDLTIVTTFISGENALDMIAKEELPELVYEQLFIIYRFARFSKIELDYLPENYIFNGKELFYVGEHFQPQNTKINLENYGIFFWFYGEQCANHLKEHNLPIDKSRILSKGEMNKKIVLTSIMKW